MDPEHRLQHRITRTQQESNRVNRLNDTDWEAFNAANASNQWNYQHNQGVSIDEEFQQYLSSFESDEKLPLEDHPYVKQCQEDFYTDISTYEPRHCNVCREQWLMP